MLETLISVIIALIGSAALASIVTAFIGRKKFKADVADNLVQTAIQIESLSTERYVELYAELKEIKQTLVNLERKLDSYEKYTKVLKNILYTHGIDCPEMEEV